jgi:hypothetical protein
MLRWWKKRSAAPATRAEFSIQPTTARHTTGPSATVPAQSLPTVKLDTSRVTPTVKTDLRRNIEGIADIEPRHRALVYEVALRAIMAGGDLGLLSRALQLEIGIAKLRANDISRSLAMKATALMNVEQCLALGFTKSVWRYSRAQCGSPEQDTAHAALDGQVFETAKGLYVLGKWTWPGREDGCKCSSSSITAGASTRTSPRD